mmetsp:Transcript_40356/g.91083  ORF Transcript_40356/g.91083 Transcript_40356/m.91083 type:complete len:287 (+) Transcript_40356:242-1102(+)
MVVEQRSDILEELRGPQRHVQVILVVASKGVHHLRCEVHHAHEDQRHKKVEERGEERLAAARTVRPEGHDQGDQETQQVHVLERNREVGDVSELLVQLPVPQQVHADLLGNVGRCFGLCQAHTRDIAGSMQHHQEALLACKPLQELDLLALHEAESMQLLPLLVADLADSPCLKEEKQERHHDPTAGEPVIQLTRGSNEQANLESEVVDSAEHGPHEGPQPAISPAAVMCIVHLEKGGDGSDNLNVLPVQMLCMSMKVAQKVQAIYREVKAHKEPELWPCKNTWDN